MARLDALPSIDIIHGLKGILDFYLWKGLPCVRSWPRTPRSHLTSGTLAAAALFGQISSDYRLLAPLALQAYQEEAKDQPRTARDLYMSGVYGHLHEEALAYPPEPPPPPEGQMYDAYLCLRDLKPQGTHGGSFLTGAWRVRDLTEKQADTKDICSLAANQFTLEPGAYRAIISCPAYMVRQNQARLYNTTTPGVLLLGTSNNANPSYAHMTRSHVVGRFTVAADQVLQIEHKCSASRSTYGFGYYANQAQEIYTIAEFWRELPEE